MEAIVNHAAIRAAVEGAPFVTMEHIEEAKDKIMIGKNGRENKNLYDFFYNSYELNNKFQVLKENKPRKVTTIIF